MHKLAYDKLTIYEVEALQKEFLSLIEEQTQDLVLDMSGVEKIDMAAIQLLLSTQKSCEKKGLKFSLAQSNENVNLDLRLCGCNKLLGVTDE